MLDLKESSDTAQKISGLEFAAVPDRVWEVMNVIYRTYPESLLEAIIGQIYHVFLKHWKLGIIHTIHAI